MEFNEKLQELRKQRGLTQEELAESLYVSRTAVSKWESGRGDPSIDSLKAIAAFFSVTVDELISSDKVLDIAEADGKQKEKRLRDLIFGAIDLSSVLLFFLPFFAELSAGNILCRSLLGLSETKPYLRIAYFAVVIGMALVGTTTLALQSCDVRLWVKSKAAISLALGIIAVLLFMISSQPYAAVFAFSLLIIKGVTLFKGQ